MTESVAARWLRRLNPRHPAVFLILLAVTILDFLVPDLIPFVDEIVLALLTALFAAWKDRRRRGGPGDGAGGWPAAGRRETG